MQIQFAVTFFYSEIMAKYGVNLGTDLSRGICKEFFNQTSNCSWFGERENGLIRIVCMFQYFLFVVSIQFYFYLFHFILSILFYLFIFCFNWIHEA